MASCLSHPFYLFSCSFFASYGGAIHYTAEKRPDLKYKRQKKYFFCLLYFWEGALSIGRILFSYLAMCLTVKRWLYLSSYPFLYTACGSAAILNFSSASPTVICPFISIGNNQSLNSANFWFSNKFFCFFMCADLAMS